MKHWIISMLAILVLTACGTQENKISNEIGDHGEKMNDGLVTKLEVKQVDKLHFSLILENQREEEVTVNFRSGQTFELIVTDVNDEVVYRFSDGKMFTQAIVTEIIPPGSSIELKDEWDLITGNERIPAGNYNVTGELLIWTVGNEEVQEDDYKVSKEIMIK